MAELPKSNCYLTYDEVITKAQTIQPHFESDLAQFTAHDAWYSQEVNTQLVKGIHTGEKDFSQKSLLSEMERVKELLDQKLAEARHSYEKLNYYVGTGFRDDTITNQTFGYEVFTMARSSAKKMIPMLNKVHEAILQGSNEERLLNSGMPAALPLELENINAELESVYGQMKMLKKQYLQITRERIELFNSLWDTLSKICEDAKIIFSSDPARLAIYELYDIEDSGTEQAEELEHI